MPEANLSIIIVAYSSKQYIKTCIESIKEYSPGAQLIVIDNNINDPSLTKSYAEKNSILLVRSENNGFGSGCNLGATLASGDVLLFLNPDTRLLSPLDPIILRLYKNEHVIASIANKINDEHAVSYGNLPSVLRALFDLGLKKLMFKEFYDKKLASTKIEPLTSVKVLTQNEYLSGAFLIMKKDTFLLLGGFDQSFFLYYEDADLCKRAHALDIPLILDASVSYEHAIGGSSDGSVEKMTLIRYSSLSKYYLKHKKVAFMLHFPKHLFRKYVFGSMSK